ncbi:MAG: cytochrome C biogenesis protein [Candidatus Latescibacterota bacterium]|jgi:cytochrome c-type biogenesis protein|nr:MAG: cytochrome C biogenesis protein [Candidatus Latescibacterota bacterium]
MIDLFDSLTGALQAGPAVALAASAAWGVLSILLSPCHLSSIPLIVGFIDGQGIVTKRRAFALAGLFSLGILVTIALIGVVTGMMGRLMGDVGRIGNYVVAAILVVIGLHLLEVVTIPFFGAANQPKTKRKGALAALLIGLAFGVALGPCTFAFMAPMLAVAFSVASTRPVMAGSLVLAYAVGHCAVIVLAGTFTSIVQRYLNWNERSKGAVVLKRVCGGLVVLGGVYLVWSVH